MIDSAVMQLIKPGVTVKVTERVKEGDKERQSAFTGIVLARKHGSEPGASFTVRATIAGVGVEKVFPVHSPMIAKAEVIGTPKRVRRAKLYYLRNRSRSEVRQRTTGEKASSEAVATPEASAQTPAAE